jgi:hypothetical protein
MRRYFFLVELGYKLLLAPDDIPIIAIDLLVRSCLEGLENAVIKISLELDRRSGIGIGIHEGVILALDVLFEVEAHGEISMIND